MHGALSVGGLATTFTASQGLPGRSVEGVCAFMFSRCLKPGLLLMVPNMCLGCDCLQNGDQKKNRTAQENSQ